MNTHQTLGLLAMMMLMACNEPLSVAPAESAPALGATQKFLRTRDAVAGQYIVVLRPDAPGVATREPSSLAAEMAASVGAQVFHTYHAALNGFAARMDERAARRLAEDPRVAYVTEDGVARGAATQLSPPWGLDRIDQRNRPATGTYRYNWVASNVHVYVIDSGIRPTHVEFGGRASADANFVGDGYGPLDCHGHGTHVAGTIGGGTYGVAKGVRLHGVRVLGCDNAGYWSGVIAGVDYVTANHVKPAVANMSLGGGANDAVDQAVRRSIAAGVVYTLAAMNNYRADACNYSPARVDVALTVAATDANDNSASFTNIGPCVDLYAPGVDVLSAGIASDTATAVFSGTSMAAPHVAGIVALFLEKSGSGMSVGDLSQAILKGATPDVVVNPGTGTPNRLLYATNPIDDTRFFVRQAYLDFLRREPDPNGFSYYVNRIELCGSNTLCIASQRTELIHAFSTAAEYRRLHPELVPGTSTYAGDYVRLHYEDMLRRAPDPQGYTFYLNLAMGGAYTSVDKDFVQSAEYRQRFGLP